MGYDLELAERVRALLATQPDLGEKRMFGGLAFLLGGRMAVAVSGSGGLMVGTPAGRTAELLTRPGVQTVEMRGRPMANWLRVDEAHLQTEEQLGEWLEIGAAAARARPRRS